MNESKKRSLLGIVLSAIVELILVALIFFIVPNPLSENLPIVPWLLPTFFLSGFVGGWYRGEKGFMTGFIGNFAFLAVLIFLTVLAGGVCSFGDGKCSIAFGIALVLIPGIIAGVVCGIGGYLGVFVRKRQAR